MKTLLALLASALLLTSYTASASEAELKAEMQKLKEMIEQKNSATTEGGTTVGGYGEINYNKYMKSNTRNQMDMRRFVLSLSHRFDDHLRFDGELETEHAIASKDDDGEVEVEQAFLTYQFSPRLSLKAGLFLMPFGFLNQSHEPPVFYGVERNEVETRIIPSTWREGGVGVFGSTDIGIDWDLGVVTGFNVAKFEEPESPLAGSHQELQMAKAHDLSVYGTLNYRIPSFVVGAGVFTGKAMQGNADFEADNANPDFAGINGRVTLTDAHARWQNRGWDAQAVYARGMISNAQDINDAINTYNLSNPGSERPFVPSEFYGWLVQTAYRFQVGEEAALSPFVRYEEFDTQAKMSTGLLADKANRDKVTTAGVSFHPHQQVVFKADFQAYSEHTENSRANLGAGFMF